MTYCPNCGTANLDGSRFCNECGEELVPQTHIECPSCGTLNPTQNILCSECGVRLPSTASPTADTTTAPAIKGLSLPTKNPSGQQDEGADTADGSEQEDDIPAWLHELGATLSGEAASDDSDAVEDSGEVPDWLRDLRASLPDDEAETLQPEERVPDWLASPEASAIDPTTPIEASEHEAEPAGEETEPVSQPASPEAELEPLRHHASDDPATAEPAEEEVPGWLARLVPTAGAEGRETEPPSRESEDAPAWLARLVPGGEEEGAAPVAADAKAEEVETVAWHNELAPAEEEAPAAQDDALDLLHDVETEPTPIDAEMEEDAIRDWLANLQAEHEKVDSEEAVPAPELQQEEIPDWMVHLQPADEEAEAEPVEPDFEIEEGELPDWVAELRPADEEIASEPWPPAVEFADEEGFPDRVTELEPPTEEIPLAEALDAPDEEAVPEEKPSFKLPEEVEAVLGSGLPTWLSELQIESPEAAAAIIEETMVDGELPDWLVHSEIEPDEALTPAEIPAWLLALKPAELRGEGEEAEIPTAAPKEGVEETGLLAGIPGILPVEMLIAQPRAVVAAELPEPSVEDSPPAQLFADVVGRTPEAAPKAIALPGADVLSMRARWVIYALLIIAVALPIIIGKPVVVRTIESSRATADMHTSIDSLNSGDPVLVAFDYDPSSSGEMDVIARALLRHLLDREARVAVVSLLPAGPATAESLLEELVAEQPSYEGQYGERYANLGYLPGQAAAVRLLGLSLQTALPNDHYGTPLGKLPLMQGLDSAQDFSLIIELAASQDTLRWWIEQAGMPYSIPLGTGASAAVLPYALPYYEIEPGQLVGVVSGVPDAVTYEALASEQGRPPDSLAARLDSQLAGQLLFVLVLLVGNVIYLLRRGNRREH